MISITDLRASYEGAEILHGISADFPAGKISVLMGPNGCGKSTTLRSLVRMVPEMSGSLTLDGQDLGALAPQELARRIALRERKMENLSGGQRQKAYLAMALAQDTEVILMDEPTTFLDIKNQFEMLDRARSLADGGKTVVMILHDFESILHYADHVVLMAEGRVLTAGGAEEVLRSAEVREAFGVEPRFYETADGVHCYVKA